MNRMQTGRNWTRKSIEELIDEYVATHNIGSGEDPADPEVRSDYNFASIAFSATCQRGDLWIVLSGQNKNFKENNFPTKYIELTNTGLQTSTEETLINIPLTNAEPNQSTIYAAYGRTNYFMRMKPETLEFSGFAYQDERRIMAGVPKIEYYKGVGRSGLDGAVVLAAWQVVGNTIYNYVWVKGETDYNDSNFQIAPASWCSWTATETAGSASDAFRAEAKIEWTAVSLFSTTFHDQSNKLLHAIQKNGTTDTDIILSTFAITTEDLKKLYPNHIVTEIKYDNET